MAHPAPPEAAVSPAPVSVDEKAAAFEDYLFGDEDEGEVPELEADADDDILEELEEGEEPDEGDEPETDDEDAEDDEAEEPDTPAIDPPVSLNAEEKEVFSQLPPEAQAAWAASETRRNTQVQEATTGAKEAQRKAEQAAASANAQAEARFGEQVKAFAEAYAPQEPDPANYHDIQSYQQAKAHFDYAKAQHDQLMQQVTQIGIETPEAKAERIKARDAQLMQIPEVADEATRDNFIASAFAVAEELGYDKADLAENMDAGDLKALAQAAKWKADAAELARIKAKSQERRRDSKTGKFKSMKPGASPQASSRRANSKKAFEKVKQARGNRAAEGEAFAEWLEASGNL